jgi:hypothetical protein
MSRPWRSVALASLLGCLILALGAPAASAQDDTSATGGTAAVTPTPTPTPAATPEPAKPRKPSVRQIQRALGIKADGRMGPRTRRAIKRFQRANGLKADGIAGPLTLAALGLGPATGRKLDAATPEEAAAVLARIAECESGGNVRAVSADGRFRGKYQFSRATWKDLGGTGDPIDADEATQDALAAKLYAERGGAPWPSCAARAE